MAEINTWPGWECVRQLGSGSFGKVYEIEKIEHGKVYKSALKVITIPQNDADIENAYSEGLDRNGVTEYFRSFVNDFTNEIALMSDLKGYTNIVSYEDHMVIPHEDKIGWDILIKMELLTPLMDWEREHPMQEDDIIRLGIDICRALELCHKNKIIHRDIKPQNIFVNKNGDFKLGDFGIARVVEKTSSVMSQKGTYTYMAPEVFRGQYYNESADIYSLGIVLYRCLNQNRTPFLPLGNMNFNDRQRAQERRMSGEAIPAPAGGSEKLKQAVLMTLQYDPGKRIQSAAVLRNILEQCWLERDNTVLPKTKVFSTIENAETSKHRDYVFEETIDEEKTVLSDHRTPVQPKKKNKTGPIAAAAIAVVAVIVVLITIGAGEKENYQTPNLSSSTASTENAPAATQDTANDQSTQKNEEDLSKTDNSEIIDVGERAPWSYFPGGTYEVDEIADLLGDDEILLTVGSDAFIYGFPQEVDIFEDHGWRVNESMSSVPLESTDAGWCVIETESSLVYLMVYNDSMETKRPKDCKVVGICGFEEDNGKFTIKGGIDYDSLPETVQTVYGEDTGYFETEDGEICYIWNDEKNIQIMYSSFIAEECVRDVMLFVDSEFADEVNNTWKNKILLWEII